MVLVVAALTGCGSSDGDSSTTPASASTSATSSGAASAGTPTKLGLIVDETGALAPLGTSYERGLKAALDVWAQDKAHAPVELKTCDSQSTGPGALSCYQRLKDSVDALSGPHLFLGFAAVKEIAQSGTVPVVTATPVANPPADSEVFQSVPTLADGAKAGMEYLKKNGLVKIGVLTSNDQSGNESNEAIKQFAGEMGMTIVANEVFDPAAQSVAPQAGKIAGAHPDAVMASTAGPQLITALRDLKAAGVTQPLMLNYASMSVPLLTKAGPAAGDNLYFYGTSAFDPSTITDAAYQDRVDQFTSVYKKANDSEPDLVAFVGADTGMIIAEAGAAQGGPGEIKDTLQGGMSLPGVLFPEFKFSTDNHVGINGQDAFTILRWQPGTKSFKAAD